MAIAHEPQRQARRRRRERRDNGRRGRERLAGILELIGLTEPDLELHDRTPRAVAERDAFKAAHIDRLAVDARHFVVAVIVMISTVSAAVIDYLLIHDLVEVLVGTKFGGAGWAAIVFVTLCLMFLELRIGLELAEAIRDLDEEDGGGLRPVVEWGVLALVLLLVVPAGVVATFVIAGFPSTYEPMLLFELAFCLVAHATVLRGVDSLVSTVEKFSARRDIGRHPRAVRRAEVEHRSLLTSVRRICIVLNDTVAAAGAAGQEMQLPPLPLPTQELVREAFGYPLMGDGGPARYDPADGNGGDDSGPIGLPAPQPGGPPAGSAPVAGEGSAQEPPPGRPVREPATVSVREDLEAENEVLRDLLERTRREARREV